MVEYVTGGESHCSVIIDFEVLGNVGKEEGQAEEAGVRGSTK